VFGYHAAAAEGWQSGRMRRSRKPLSVVRRIEGSNPSPSAQPSESRPIGRDFGMERGQALARVEGGLVQVRDQRAPHALSAARPWIRPSLVATVLMGRSRL
jgi:hypothetical protein